MTTTFKLYSSLLLCLALTLMSGCGSGLTSAERTKANKILADNGKNAIQHYVDFEGSNDGDLDFKYIKYFVSKGADVNAGGGSPLRRMASLGNLKAVRFLVSKGAHVNEERYDGKTLLHDAVRSGNIEIVKFLVSKGADVNAKTEKRLNHPGGETPLDLAKQEGWLDDENTKKGKKEIAEYLSGLK